MKHIQIEISKYTYSISGTFFIFCAIILCAQYVFMCITQKHCRRHWQKCCKLVAPSLLHDVVFVFMGTLYLAGDNLPILICRGESDDAVKEDCIKASSYVLVVSQLLHTALYLANTFKLSPAKATFPVIGWIRKAYQSILQLVGFTIFIDQNFSTVVTLITHIDIEADDGPNGTGNVTASQYDVGGFAAALFAIVLPIVLGLVVKNYKDYCSCFKECKSCYRCCCNCQCFQNGVISVQYFLLFVFMGMYTLADNRWLWKYTALADIGDPTKERFGVLIVLFLFNIYWILLYVFILCLPGVGIVCKKKGFFDENENVTVLAEKEVHEWKFTYAKGKDIKGRIIDLKHRNGMEVEEDFRSVSVTLPIDENDITCKEGLKDCCKWLFCDLCCQKGRNSEDKKTTEDEKAIIFTYFGKKKEFYRSKTL